MADAQVPASPSAPQYVLDFTTARELIAGLCFLVPAFGFFFWITIRTSLDDPAPAESLLASWHCLKVGMLYGVPAILGAAFIGLSIFDDHYVLDVKTRTIWLHRRMLGWTDLSAYASFDEVKCLVLERVYYAASGLEEPGFDWRLHIGLLGKPSIDFRGGTLREETEPRRVSGMGREMASRLSTILGVPVQESERTVQL